MRAWVAELDGKVIAIGGVAYTRNVAIVFLEHEDGEPLKRWPLFMHRTCRKMLADVLAGERRPVYSEEGRTPTARRWLRRLGFRGNGDGSFLICQQ